MPQDPFDLRYAAVRTVLNMLSWSGVARLATPYTGGLGAILTLHHVRPARDDAFQPNRILEITPEFLDTLLGRLAASGIEFVSLDEAHRRVRAGRSRRRFVCLTFDDGYRDNAEFARPILARHGAPWTLFVTTAFADGTGEMWWLVLEAAIARASRIEVDFGKGREAFDCATVPAKWQTFRTVYWRLRALDEPGLLKVVRRLAADHGIVPADFCRELCLRWDELARLAADPMVSIGAHTVTHPRLATLSTADAIGEMRHGRDIIEDRLRVRPMSFAYPVGDPASAGQREFDVARHLGYRMAVTTRPGVLTKGDAARLHSLPRISVNGLFQHPRYVEALLSGLPFLRVRGSRAGNRASASSG